MNAAEYKALQINMIIKGSSIYQEYVNIKKSLSSKYELKEQEIKELQQELVNSAYKEDPDFEKKKEEYYSKYDNFYNDPLMKKFIAAYKELNNMINNLKNIIESEV